MSNSNWVQPLNYNPEDLPRETKRHYISLSDKDIKEMLDCLGLKDEKALFSHIPPEVQFSEPLDLPQELSYRALQERLQYLSNKNNIKASFIGDGLQHYSTHSIVEYVCSLRNLTTAYTPYQPERSQGTLITHWLYQCAMSMLTGFEAINASLYDRSTAIFEAMCCALRLQKKADTVLVSLGVHPNDIEVINTLIQETKVNVWYIPVDETTGYTDIQSCADALKTLGDKVGAIVFPQINHLGIHEDVDALTRLAFKHSIKSIAVIDPMLLATKGLKPPVSYGDHGVDIIAGEAQHMAIGANFGGPGLGLFAVRYNENLKNDIRSTPGRFVGKAKDIHARDCFVIVLSTREQHIRKEKATSNICSNQAFLATLAGASILARGDAGMTAACLSGFKKSRFFLSHLLALEGVKLAFPNAFFFNECVLEFNSSLKEYLQKASAQGLHIGVDVSGRFKTRKGHFLKISFSDHQSEQDLNQLIQFFKTNFKSNSSDQHSLSEAIPSAFARQGSVGLPNFSQTDIKSYYKKLADLNVSPDDSPYPLGSCTMKYNPYVNDWAASLKGFTQVHPQAPIEDAQGSLEILYEIQEWFKAITGLPGVTTQPVAGAQGELVGLKLFQAYHKDRGDSHRNVVFIPKSAHGTNFATAVMAGISESNIVYLSANDLGQIDLQDLDEKLAKHGDNLCAVMVTNPNTSGIFESRFKDMAERVHAHGGLVYMDGANMNAIAGWVNLKALGVDAVHNNLHKTWTIPHGGGGPGDAIVAVSDSLVDFLPGYQIKQEGGIFKPYKAPKSIGSFHRHWGNFGHKVRCLSYLYRLGQEGVSNMSSKAVLSARYLYHILSKHFPTLPEGASKVPRMHEFIITLSPGHFEKLEASGLNKSSIIPRVGKMFLDFGFHAPTVAFPEVFGLMIEPTESYTKQELDRFAQAILAIKQLIEESPESFQASPRVTPIDRVDEVAANRQIIVSEPLTAFPKLFPNRQDPQALGRMEIPCITKMLTPAVT